MRTLLVALAALALLTLVPSPAAAQQSAAMTVALNAPETLSDATRMVTFSGTITFTADLTGYTGINGIPVTYTVTKNPTWATVLISPATDVFPVPAGPPVGLSYTVTKTITVTIGLADDPTEDVFDQVEITATTTPTVNGKAAVGKGAAPVSYDAPDQPCPDHLGDPRLAALAVEAADAYNEWQAAKEDEDASASSDDVHVQSAGASTLPLPWVAVAGFALVGAAVGLVVRRRLR